MSAPNQRKTASKTNRDNTRLDIRRLPTSITGVPQELFNDFQLEILFTGPNSTTAFLREKKADGSLGKSMPIDEAIKLAKAPGFVRAAAKEETRSELTEMTRALFFNTGADPKIVKEPKLFTKRLLDLKEGVEKTEALLQRAGPSIEDQEACKFLKEMLNRGKEAMNNWVADRLKGGTTEESQFFLEAGFPKCMKTRVLGGDWNIGPNGVFWQQVYGKKIQDFCPLTLGEIMTMPQDDLSIFYPSGLPEDLKKLQDVKTLAVMNGNQEWDSVPDAVKKRMLAFTFPIEPRIRVVEMLQFYEKNRTIPTAKDASRAPWPALDVAYNSFTKKVYKRPPLDVTKVKEFWEGVANTNLAVPGMGQENYRAQTIEHLLKAGLNPDPKRIPEPESGKPLIIKGQTMGGVFATYVSATDSLGRVIKSNDKWENYLPPEIVGFDAAKKKKKTLRKQQGFQAILHPKSERYIQALTKQAKPVHPDVMSDVKEYLRGFATKKIQILAAKLIYVTNLLTADSAASKILRAPAKLEEEEEDSDGGNPDEGKEEDLEEPFPEDDGEIAA